MFPDFRGSRRRWLMRAGALAASSGLPLWLPRAWSQSQSTLDALPRIALVMGNTDYAQAPLRNPVNDAKAIGAELQKFQFKVSLQLNAGRAQMVNAIQAFGGDLAKSKGVGLFYYAGHGAQLTWRNYLIPVDVEIETLEDMRNKAVELNSLLQGLIAARNPMNMIILDACRDNPFGNKVLIEQRGLSQFDAPPGSLLAYATSPGKTAADGEGENGLYTESLLRELTVPAAKIEDVFKRVRLAVRLKSQGRQVPWESTSLEEDFYFLPPKQARKLSEEELIREFEDELAVWDKIKSSQEPAPIEDYLRRYPSGKFSELAQFRLERLLAKLEKPVQVASVASLTSVQTEADRKRQEELARAEAELKKQQELAKEEAERKQREELARDQAERARQDALAKAEAERKRLEDLARVETERRRQEDLAKADAERRRQEDLRRAEAEVKKQQEIAKAEADRKQQEELARAEAELKRQQELAKAEAERKRGEEIARAEAERRRQEALIQAEAERKRLEEQARAEAERKKIEDLARAEAQRRQQEKLALAEAEARKQKLLAQAGAERDRQKALIGTAQVASVQIAPNPYSKGTGKVDANYQPGDIYRYRRIDTLTQLETRQITLRVTDVTDSEVIYNGGKIVKDLLGNLIKAASENQLTDQQFFISEYSIGKKWTTRYRFMNQTGEQKHVVIDFKVVAREIVSVPAGTFDAFKVEGTGFNMERGALLQYTYWIAPDKVRQPIIFISIERGGGGGLGGGRGGKNRGGGGGRGKSYRTTNRDELIAYRQRS